MRYLEKLEEATKPDITQRRAKMHDIPDLRKGGGGGTEVYKNVGKAAGTAASFIPVVRALKIAKGVGGAAKYLLKRGASAAATGAAASPRTVPSTPRAVPSTPRVASPGSAAPKPTPKPGSFDPPISPQPASTFGKPTNYVARPTSRAVPSTPRAVPSTPRVASPGSATTKGLSRGATEVGSRVSRAAAEGPKLVKNVGDTLRRVGSGSTNMIKQAFTGVNNALRRAKVMRNRRLGPTGRAAARTAKETRATRTKADGGESRFKRGAKLAIAGAGGVERVRSSLLKAITGLTKAGATAALTQDIKPLSGEIRASATKAGSAVQDVSRGLRDKMKERRAAKAAKAAQSAAGETK